MSDLTECDRCGKLINAFTTHTCNDSKTIEKGQGHASITVHAGNDEDAFAILKVILSK